MADDKKIGVKREDPKVTAARMRAAALAKAGPGFSFQRAGQFLKDTASELKKTTWPDRNTLWKSTGIVLAFIFATAVWNGFFDLLLTRATANVFGH
jgi:preprotein translocase SecE subunit